MLKLQEVEALEREEGLASVKEKMIKMKSGKMKKQKVLQEETLPSPVGRRVEPRVDTAMKQKASKLTKATKVGSYLVSSVKCSGNIQINCV